MFLITVLTAMAQTTTPPPSSPTPSPKLLTPVEAVKRFIEGVSAVEVSWIIVGLGLVWGLYFLSINQLRSTTATWKVVLRWIAGLGGWFFVMYIFGWDRIYAGGWSSLGLGLLSAALAFFA